MNNHTQNQTKPLLENVSKDGAIPVDKGIITNSDKTVSAPARELERELETVRCSNCGCEFKQGEHDEVMCNYLNR